MEEKSQEHKMQFAPENYWTGDFESMNYGLPSKYDIDAIEESEILLLREDDLKTILR